MPYSIFMAYFFLLFIIPDPIPHENKTAPLAFIEHIVFVFSDLLRIEHNLSTFYLSIRLFVGNSIVRCEVLLIPFIFPHEHLYSSFQLFIMQQFVHFAMHCLIFLYGEKKHNDRKALSQQRFKLIFRLKNNNTNFIIFYRHVIIIFSRHLV